MRQLTIAGRVINDDEDPYVIAELGSNHGGSLDTARAMIRAAAAAGADAVKLQKRNNRELYTAEFYDQPNTSEHSFGATYGEHREALELGVADYQEISQFVDDLAGPKFICTAFDQSSADFLMRLTADRFDRAGGIARVCGLDAFKIASSDLVNVPFLKYVAGIGKPMILSTGAASWQDVDRAVNAIWPINQQLALLQCTAMYPAPAERLNLRVITTYRDLYPNLVVGYSSHYAHPYDSLVAYTLGARIFEKHFTLDRAAKGTDHAFSLEPDGFAGMVKHLKAARLMLGDGLKVCQPEEQPAIDKMRKSTRWYQELYANAIR